MTVKNVGHKGETGIRVLLHGMRHGCLHFWRVENRYWGNGVCEKCHVCFHEGVMSQFQRRFFRKECR